MKKLKTLKTFHADRLKRIFAPFLCAAMVLPLAACGNQEIGSDTGEEKEFVYVPEYITLGDGNSGYYDNLSLIGNSLYYSQYQWDETTMESRTVIAAYSLEDGTTSELPVGFGDGMSLQKFILDQDGNIIALLEDYSSGETNSEGYAVSKKILQKYDSQGNCLLEQDVTDTLNPDGSDYFWVSAMAVDEQGNLYFAADSKIILLSGEGQSRGSVGIDNGWIYGMGKGKNGKIYFAYNDYNSTDGGTVLGEIDFEGQKIANTYGNFPGSNGTSQLIPGVQKDFLVSDGSSVYEYDMATQTKEEVLNWLDSDINGSYVNYINTMENGDILVVLNDWNTGNTEIAKLVKTNASEVVQKEQITIGTLYGVSSLQAAAVAFNKSSDKYHVTIKAYMDPNSWSESSYSDAVTALNNDITSGANCPDILDLSGVDVETMSSKGVFEDLTPYLEKSSVISKDDFIESILASYTYDGRLISIPSTFTINTVAGKTSLLGEEMGWSLQDMIAFAEEHPGAQLFETADKSTMMFYCMMYNEDAFIDWSKGECNFDSDEFKALLEFVNMFPDEFDWNSYDGGSGASQLQSGEVLLNTVNIYDFQEIQIYPAMFGEDVTFIGFPTTDGSVGCGLNATGVYAIAAKSAHKDGAWAFMENYLTDSQDFNFSWGFPTKKDQFQELLDEAVNIEYLKDENGELILNENGDPIPESGTSAITYGDWQYTYHIPTEEEVQQIKDLISVARPVSFNNGNDEIMEIIDEEAAAYFEGQKSLDDVAGVIQSRAQIFVSENS